MTTATITPPTYPCRPINGGPFDQALPKSGEWIYEPKFNGWRALVHVPSGTMFNRHNQPMSISADFEKALAVLADQPFEWLDCEALERRHSFARGCLIVLDALNWGTSYVERHEILDAAFGGMHLLDPKAERWPLVCVPRQFTEPADSYWNVLQQVNKSLGAEFYEGFVAKRANSLYPHQLRSAREEFAGWMKHRWAF